MDLRESCGRCAAICYERNPLVARMLGLCPLLAITDTALDGVVFGGFFVTVLCASALLVPSSRYLVTPRLRPLMFQLGVGVISLKELHNTGRDYSGGVSVALRGKENRRVGSCELTLSALAAT